MALWLLHAHRAARDADSYDAGMIEVQALQGQVRALVEDLRARVASDEALAGDLRREYEQADRARRVGGGFDAWLEGVLDQAAVAWVLGCVFVRFCEDNRLVQPWWLGGPEEWASVSQAVQARQAYVIANPLHNDRHWLREAFSYLAGLRATGELFDEHNPVWRFDISGQAAEELSDFFRRGDGFVSLAREDLDTRFLGDVYQDLSAHARETYALLQTPGFVEEFILDRAFEPALAEFGLPQMSVIDPTCGSGHFLLGAFDRLVARWREREPGTDVRVLVERALGQVTGVDVNPFAVAIARFRLMVAALRACGLTELERAPQFPVRVATGDALLPWGDPARAGEQVTLDGESLFAFATEDAELLAEFLRPRQYAVVVGNPPYITVKDKAQNARYRELYSACSGKYALTVPFAQRFFELAKRGGHDGHGAGWVGQITSNSFMKREFGKKLIEDYLASQVELTEVIDTSGAYIPGHGTPTVILIGRDRLPSPRYSGKVRTVLGIRGEPSQPEDPGRGLVWSAIVNQIDQPGSESEWISVTDFGRDQMGSHPWSLSGGGAVELTAAIEDSASRNLDGVAESLGITSFTLEDDLYVQPARLLVRRNVNGRYVRPMVLGDGIRDWGLSTPEHALFPYDSEFAVVDVEREPDLLGFMWPARTCLANNQMFGRQSKVEAGLKWSEYGRLTASKLRTPLSIAFAFVATHNHFVLDRGGKVFNRSAPVIKLPEGAGEEEHLRLLGVLNSSTACFWLKQVSHDKGIRGQGGGFTSDDWEHFYEFTGTKLQEFPLPGRYPLELARELDALATRLGEVSPAAVAESGVPTRERLRTARDEWHSVRARMIALQEELDWQVYRLYGLTEDELTTDKPPELALGQRAFEIVLARKVAAGEVDTAWFERHGSTPVTELPGHWPAEYRDLVQRRIELIESDRNIGLIERPECKRRWSTDGWDAMQTRALRDWLLDRLEAPQVWGPRPVPMSVAQVADRVRHDEEFRHVLDLWVGNDQHDPVKTLGALVADEQVPFLASYRYKPSGLRKRAAWERTWELQRLEDQGKPVEIEVPPKYTSGDFVRNSYWRNRGKLDVPKERFISYPKAGRDGDDTDLLGWAGWDHLQQAQALATIYLDRKQQGGWPGERLLPLLAGIAELEPWLHQWHADPQPGYTGSPAEFFTGLIDTELATLDADRTTLATVQGIDKAG